MSVNSKISFTQLNANRNIASREYWKDRLLGFEFNPYFIRDREASGVLKGRNYASYTLQAAGAIYEAITAIAPKDKSKHIVLLSAMGVFIQKCSSIDDITIFTPLYEEIITQDEDNSLSIMRMNDFSSLTFSELLLKVKENLMQDFKYSNYPINKILNHVTAYLDEIPVIGMLLEGIQQKTAFRLEPDMLFCFNVNDGLRLTIKYDADKFSPSYISQIAALYLNLLHCLINNRGEPIREIELITPEEKQKILTAFNDTERQFPYDITIMDLFIQQVRRFPDNTAIQSGEQQLSYRELDLKSNQVANFLTRNVAGKGAIVGVSLERSQELMIAVFGILKAGCVYLPLTTDYPVDRIRYILKNSNTGILITNRSNKDNLHNEFQCVEVSDMFGYPEEEIALAKTDDMAYLIYTSGSTGKPKGVLIKHRSLMNRLNWMQNQYKLDETDVILQKTPLVFDVSVWELCWWCFNGSKLVLAAPEAERDPARIARIVEDERITVIHFVPAMLNEFLYYLLENSGKHDLSTIKHLFTSGEELKVDHAKQFFRYFTAASLHNLYGPTEATIDVSFHEVAKGRTYYKIPIGRPVDNTSLFIFNKENQLQPVGIPGELYIGGENVSPGYINQVELTHDRFVRNPMDPSSVLYKTGDMARWLPDGNIEFLGRADDQLKINGNRIELTEIEQVIKSSALVKDAVVLTKKFNSTVKLVAFLVESEGFSESSLRQFLKVKLPEYMIPNYFLKLAAIPVNVNGKVNRKELLSLEIPSDNPYIPPTSALEKKLATQWAAVLMKERIGTADNFFRMGGDSILAIRLIGRLSNELLINISAADLYANPTIRELADFIELACFKDPSDDYKGIDKELEYFHENYLAVHPDDSIEKAYPMSDIERAMCFISLARPEDVLNFEQNLQPVYYEVFNIEKLQQALVILIKRHEILRIGFDLQHFAHIVYKSIRYDIPFHDLSSLDEEAQKHHIFQDLGRSRQMHFDLRKPPLWRLSVYKLRESYHEVLFECHHAIFDGWSLASFITELNNTYGELLREQPVDLQPLAASYKDYISNQLFHKSDSRAKDFWKKELKDYKVLKLNSRTGPREFYSVRYTYPRQLLIDLERVAKERNTTVKSILFSAYIYALKVLSCETDILAGLVTFARPLKKDGDKLLGCFLNTIPFRINIPAGITWADFLRKMDDKVLELKQYEHLSLSEIKQAVNVSTIHDNPFFNTLFNFVNWHINDDLQLEQFSEQDVNRIEFDSFLRGYTFLDITLNVNKERIYCMHEYASPFITPGIFKEYTSVFDTVLQKFITTPDENIDLSEIYWGQQFKEANRKLKEYINGVENNGTEPGHEAISLWQQEVLPGLEVYLLSYWKKQLAGNLKPLDLPTSRPRSAAHPYTKGIINIPVSGVPTAKVLNYSNSSGIPVNIILMAAFKIVLSRYSQQEEITIGVHVDNRDVTGPVANMIALRSFILPAASFNEYGSALREIYDEALQYKTLPFDRLLEELAPETEAGRQPLFDVLFGYSHNVHQQAFTEGTEIGTLEMNSGFGKYDMDLFLQRNETGIQGSLCFNLEYFDQPGMEQLVVHWTGLLETLLENPNKSISELELLSDKEREQLQQNLDRRNVIYPRDMTVTTLFELQVKRSPDDVALKFDNTSITYGELDRRASQAAFLLRKKGVERGEVVALLMDRSIELIVGILGILKSGAAYLPIDEEYPEDRINYLIKDSNAKILLSSSRIRNDRLFNIPVAFVEEAVDVHSGYNGPSLPIHPSDPCYVIYTSGSTGAPKGVMISHRNVVRLLFNDEFQYDFGPNDIWPMFHSHCFDVSVWEIFGALLFGGRLVIIPKMTARDPKLFLELLRKEKVTVLNQTPSAFYNLMHEAVSGTELLPDIRYIIFAGERLSPAKLRPWRTKYPDVKLINMYGITEITVHATYKEIGAYEIENDISNIGKPLPTLSIYILDQYQKMLPEGVIGEIYVGGAGVAISYLGNKELSEKRFITDPYHPGERVYRSGDLARILSSGEIEYIGRIDNQIKIRGFRVELGEIENHLNRHDQIKESVVVLKGKDNNEQLVAYCVAEVDIDPITLKDFLAANLPEYMLPASYMFLKELPLTPNGKLDKRSLPDPELRATADYMPASNPIEEMLVRIYAETLQVDISEVSVNANIFDLGVHSLMMPILISNIYRDMYINLQIKALFQYSTVSKLAAHLSTLIK